MERKGLLRRIKKGFSTAEILISLTIIGVIAALTAPALIQNIRETIWKSSYKKAYSAATQAWMTAITKKKIIITTNWWDGTAHNTNFNIFKSQFNVIKDCADDAGECWDIDGDTFFDLPVEEGEGPGSMGFIDSAGMAWIRCCTDAGCAGEILVDTNGFSEPNKFGRDRFILKPYCRNAGYPCKPVLLAVPDDVTIADDSCEYGNCYYTSWLANED